MVPRNIYSFFGHFASHSRGDKRANSLCDSACILRLVLLGQSSNNILDHSSDPVHTKTIYRRLLSLIMLTPLHWHPARIFSSF